MAQNIVFRVVADTQPAVDGMNKLDNATKKASKDVSGLDDALGKIGGMVAGAFAVERLIAFGKEVLNVTKQFESIQIRLNSIAGGAIEGQKAMDDLRILANKLGLEFKGLANEYVNFVGAAKASGMEVSKADKIFKSMSVAIAGSGASAESAGRAMTALTQMIGKGKISAEELRGQLGEALPSAMGIMAKSLGVTTQQLDKMMANGELLASEVLPKFASEMERAFGGDAEKLADGLQGSLNRLSNAWDSFMLNIGNSAPFDIAINALTGLINAVDRGVQVLTKGTTEAYLSGKKTEQTLQAQAVIKNINQKLDEKQLTIDQKKEALNKLLETGQKKENELLLERGKVRKEVEKGGGDFYANKKRLFDLFELTQKQQVYNEALKSEIKLLQDEGAEKAKTTTLTDAQIKSLEKERKEREKLQALKEKEQYDDDMQAMNEKIKNEDYLANTILMITKFNDEKRLKNRDDFNSKYRSKIKGSDQTVEEITKSNFERELRLLNMQYDDKLIKDEDYLKALAKLREKYGLKEKKNFETKETEIANIKASKEQLVRQMAIDSARGTVDTIMAYRQKELDGEAEMVEKQRQAGLIGQEQYDQQLRAIKRKQAVADRINAIAQIAIGTAVQVASNPLPLAPFIISLGAIQTGIVLAQPLPYNKGTKRVPMMRGAMRGRDSVHAILTPDERVVPADINTQPGYSALLDLAQDKKISDKEAGFLAELATSGMRRTNTSQTIDPDTIGRAIAKYIPHTNVAINERGIAVITERSQTEIRRLRRRIS
jgi:tape measure domain-containing protein